MDPVERRRRVPATLLRYCQLRRRVAANLVDDVSVALDQLDSGNENFAREILRGVAVRAGLAERHVPMFVDDIVTGDPLPKSRLSLGAFASLAGSIGLRPNPVMVRILNEYEERERQRLLNEIYTPAER